MRHFDGFELMERLFPVVIGAMILAIFAGLFAAAYDAYTWPDYAEEHGCKPVNLTRDKRGMSCQTIGEQTFCSEQTTTKELWVCRDGERHWRTVN